MRVPERLEPLLAFGAIEEVLRPLMSGKEAEVYLVLAGGEERVAKVYKDAQQRSFQHRAEYTEGRRVRSSREQRAMNKGSRHGRARTEDAWRSAEVDAIQLLRSAGVRVPEPHVFSEGVLVMELVKDETGAPAPRLVDRVFDPEEAVELFHVLLREVVKMLCAGVIHADLSDFNVLLGADGPVIIDFPQAVDPARNQSARKLLIRDVKNLTSFLGRFAPALRRTQYGPEMWDLYERSELEPDTELTGRFDPKQGKAEVTSLLEDILELEKEAKERRAALGLPPPRRARRPIVFEEPAPPPAPRARKQRGKPKIDAAPAPPAPRPSEPVEAGSSDAPKKKRRRRRKRSTTREGGAPVAAPEAAPPKPVAQAAPRPSPEQAATEERPRRRRRRRRRRSSGEGATAEKVVANG